MILDMAEVAYDFKIVDQCSEESKEAYMRVNPTGVIPLIEEKTFKVIGGSGIFYVYLLNS